MFLTKKMIFEYVLKNDFEQKTSLFEYFRRVCEIFYSRNRPKVLLEKLWLIFFS